MSEHPPRAVAPSSDRRCARRITPRLCTRNSVSHDVLHDLRHRRSRRRLPGVRHQGFQGTYVVRDGDESAEDGWRADALTAVTSQPRVFARREGLGVARASGDACAGDAREDARGGNFEAPVRARAARCGGRARAARSREDDAMAI